MALEGGGGGALSPLQAGWGGMCPWCPPASATYVNSKKMIEQGMGEGLAGTISVSQEFF